MYKELMRTIFIFIICIVFQFPNLLFADTIKDIKVIGNERISTDTIKVFSTISINDNLNDININEVLKKIYETNFFQDVSIKLDNNTLIIEVIENPIINNIEIAGIKSKSLIDEIFKNINLKSRSSFNEFLLKKDKNLMTTFLKDQGYYFSEIEIIQESLDDNKINLIFNIDLGNKAKIKKISFVGDKVFKDNKLKSIIISEEYKFWKFISGKKYLNENVINFDNRLLKNFYLNKGFFKVSINSSFARLIEQDEFELVFNIDSNDKYFFNELILEIPPDFNKDNFTEIKFLLN
jgi:outer membrane protein insertion porin family